jgi:hypothetical protein
LFFFSGACALVYQVLWLRTLGWVFGVTVYAASAVWAMFMAGLALGSGAAGLVADRVRHPLRWFGVTELLIGATALFTPAWGAATPKLDLVDHIESFLHGHTAPAPFYSRRLQVRPHENPPRAIWQGYRSSLHRSSAVQRE